MMSGQGMDDMWNDTEFTLANIPFPKDEHCRAVGCAMKTFVMSRAASLDEMKKRRLLIEFLNNKFRDIKLGSRLVISGASANILGFTDPNIYARIISEPPLTGEEQAQSLIAKMLDFFGNHQDFEIVDGYGSAICVKSHWEKGSKAKMVLQWGDELDEIGTRLYAAYMTQSPLVLPLIQSLDMWMMEQRLDAALPCPFLEVAAIMTIFYLIKSKELSIIEHSQLTSCPRRISAGKDKVTEVSLGFHWIRLLRFYAVEFDPLKDDIVICGTQSYSSGGPFIADPVKPDFAIIPRPDTPAFHNIILAMKQAYLYFAIPRSVPGSLYHRILPTAKANWWRVAVFHKFVRIDPEASWKPLEPLSFIEWDPLVIAESVKGKNWRQIEDIKGLDLESIRVRIFDKVVRGRTLRYVLEDDVNLLSGIFHPWFYKYEFCHRPDDLLLVGMEQSRYPVLMPSQSPIVPLSRSPILPPSQSPTAPPSASPPYPPPVMPAEQPVPLVPIPVIPDPVENGLQDCLTILNSVINVNFAVDGMREEDYLARVEVLADLYKAIQPLQYSLQTFGSCCNGFGRRFSDLDVSVMTDKQDDYTTLHQIKRRLLAAKLIFRCVEFIPAEVPVVKFFHVRHGVEGDISFNNLLGFRNTQLLRMYAEIDPRVKILGVFLKTVTKITGVNDSVNGYLSSYALIVMLIHFLQRTTPPVLPALQELSQMFSKRVLIREYDVTFFDDLPSLHLVWPFRFTNKQSVGELWHGFLNYYLEVFDGKNDVVTIRTLQPLLRSEKTWRQRSESLFVIQDPFITDKNLARTINSEKSPYFLEVFNQLRRMCYEDCYHRLLTKQEFQIPRQPSTVKEQEEKKLKDDSSKSSVSGHSTQSGEKAATTVAIADKSVSLELSIESNLSTLKI